MRPPEDVLDALEGAPCIGTDLRLWFPKPAERPVEAEAICASCPLPTWTACLRYVELVEGGLPADHVHGYAAGFTPRERAAEWRARRERP